VATSFCGKQKSRLYFFNLFGNRLYSMKRFYQYGCGFIREGKLQIMQILGITPFIECFL